MEENTMIQEAEIEKVESEEKQKATEAEIKNGEKKKKAEMYVEFALIFILGILIGVALKTEAVKRITMGFDDYQMKIFSQEYDINRMQMELSQKIEEKAEEKPQEVQQGEVEL